MVRLRVIPIIFIHREPTTSISELLAPEETAEPSPFM